MSTLEKFRNWRGKNVLILDTETTGLKRNKDRIVSIAWLFIENFSLEKLIKEKDNIQYYIRKQDPHDRFPIGCYFIHGINDKICERYGILFSEILNRGLREALMNSHVIIAHNISFDIGMLKYEFLLMNTEPLLYYKLLYGNFESYCSMHSNTILCNLKDKRGGKKKPKLIELYTFLYRQEYDKQLHNARNDVELLTLCIIRLIQNFENITNIDNLSASISTLNI